MACYKPNDLLSENHLSDTDAAETASSLNSFTDKLILGSVQFGVDYGISNTMGKVARETTQEILTTARELGIERIDSAAGYGNAEQVLGDLGVEDFQVGSKFSVASFGQKPYIQQLLTVLQTSLDLLGKQTLEYWMIHDPEILLDGKIDKTSWVRALDAVKETGKVRKIGVSVYTSKQAYELRKLYPFEIVQIPTVPISKSLWSERKFDAPLVGYSEVHGRSALLQGLLTMAADVRPNYFNKWDAVLDSWAERCTDMGLSSVEAAIRIILGNKRVNRIVVGVTKPNELTELATFLERGPIGNFIEHMTDDPALLNPGNWQT